MLATVDSICAKQDLTRSQVFRRSVMEYLKSQSIASNMDVNPTEAQGEWFSEWREGLADSH